MRALRLMALALLIMVAGVAEAAAQRYSVTGRVVSTEAEAVAYATVVITQDNSQVAGGATDSNGEFTLKAPEGDYTLNISYIGYKKHPYELSLKGDIALGDITLETDATQIDAVVITSDIIRREADRFVVDVANSPIALGKDGE